MTIAQKVITAYLRDHAPEHIASMSLDGDDGIEVAYKSGQRTRYSCNLYGDILECQPSGNHRLIAQVDRIGDLELIGQDMPSAWVDV